MAKKKDMLEAFRSAGKLTPLPPAAPYRAGGSSARASEGAGGPATEPEEPTPTANTPQVRQAPEEPVPDPARDPAVTSSAPVSEVTAGTATQPAGIPVPTEQPIEPGENLEFSSRAFPPISGPVVLLLVLIIAAFGGGAWLANQPVDASEGDGEEPQEASAGSTLADADGPTWLTSVPAEAASSVDSSSIAPLQDPRNKYTLVVITYGAGNEELAWATHDHLLDEGIDVHAPHRVGDKIVVFAGATPTYAELGNLEQRVRAIQRDGVSGIYEDAYAIRIDDYIER